MNFKIADFQKGTRDSRSLFTRETLKGGPVEPNTIVDAYINANRALFETEKVLYKDIEDAITLNANETELAQSLIKGVGKKTYGKVSNGIFTPVPSDEVKNAFAINADKLGLDNPYEEAGEAINEIYGELLDLDLDEGIFPSIDNPLLPIMQDTPTTPMTLNLPNVEGSVLTQQNAANQYSNLTMDQKIRLLFPNG